MNLVGYTIGRFNPLQKGHLALLQKVHDENDRMVVLIGSATESRTHKNPLTYEERRQLVAQAFPSAVIVPLPDLGNDVDWMKLFESTISMAITSMRLDGPVHARLYSADATRADDYALRCKWVARLGHEVVPFVPVKANTDLSASLVRDCWYNGRYTDLENLVPEPTLALLQSLDIGWMRSPYVKRVDTGERAEHNVVCVAFAAQSATALPRGEEDQAASTVLGYVARHNGELAFAGGKVLGSESVEGALVRQVKESLNVGLSADDLVPVCTHAMTGQGRSRHVHLFMHRTNASELRDMRRRCLDAPLGAQGGALLTTALSREAQDNLLRHRWTGSAREQLQVLLWSGLLGGTVKT